MRRRADVWITGIGAHTAAGPGAASLREALSGCASRAAPAADLGGHWVARAPDPQVGRLDRRLDRSSQFFLVAAREAWRNAGLDRTPIDPDRIAVIDGSSLGPSGDLLAAERNQAREGFPERVHPAFLLRMMFGAGGAVFAQEVGAHGAVFALSAGSTSGMMTVLEGWSKIRSGLADVVVAGGADAPLDPEIVAVFRAAGILAPAAAGLPCRPFDVARTGTMLGEGAGVVVLERAEHAYRRGVAPLAVLEGVGVSGEDGSMLAPDPSGTGIARAARHALGHAGVRRVGWIKAHGTATRVNDLAECRALAGSMTRAPFTSMKPLLGHCLGASGAVELVAAVIALGEQFIPPTLGTTHVDPSLGKRRIALEPERLDGSVALLLSQSLGGRCAALALARAS
ncbi:MAG: beta-ketoacyl-[acyl-carrier-protein] synthase family protein [Gemmatimonadales bacterium]